MRQLIKSLTQNPKNDILSGLTVALALVPEAIAFAFIAGIDPLVGLYGAFMMGLITAIFGGRPGMISGATGAMAVVMVHLVSKGNEVGAESFKNENLGTLWLFVTLLMVGAIQMLAGVFKLGKFVRLIPHPVMMGFVNGLAIVIFLSQIGLFKQLDKDIFGNNKLKTNTKELVYNIEKGKVKDIVSGHILFEIKDGQLVDNETKQSIFTISENQIFNNNTKQVVYQIKDQGIYTVEKSGFSKSLIPTNELLLMILFVILTMSIMHFLPKLTKKFPSALAAIMIVAAITILGGLDVKTVGTFIRESGGDGLKGSLPSFQMEIFEVFHTMNGHWGFIISTAFILAAIGLIESLMTLNLIDELTETRGSGNRECLAQGGANFINGLFGGMGGCAMIGQSIINVNSGGRGRLSGIFAAVALLCFILFGSALIEKIPIAALVGVMFMVVIGTFAWSSFRILHKIPLSDALVLIAVSAITVWKDLAVAVIAGVIISALVFAWKNATMIRARKRLKEDGTKVYEIWGPLFFGSIQNFNFKFNPKEDPKNVEIDFMESKVSDHSGIEALFNLAERYKQAEKQVTFTHLSPDCKRIMLKKDAKIRHHINIQIDDPRYYVVTDSMDEEV